MGNNKDYTLLPTTQYGSQDEEPLENIQSQSSSPSIISKGSSANTSEVEIQPYTASNHIQVPNNDLYTSRTFDEVAHLSQPEETPLGRHLGIYAVITMVIQRVVGSGIFAVSAIIYRDVGGSPALFFLVWIIAGYTSFAGLFCFLELGTIVPRSGAMKVFLEYIYYRPRMLMSVLFNSYSLLFGFVITNAIIFGQYTLYAIGYEDVTQSMLPKYVGALFVVLICLVLSFSTKVAMHLQNVMSFLKISLMLIMSLTGIYVLLVPRSITKLPNNLHFDEFFKVKRPFSLSTFVSALLKAIFSFSGWQSCHAVQNEVKDPVRTIKLGAPIALLVINVCYFFINLSYLVVISDEELSNSGEMVGSLLFEKIFGYVFGRLFLTLSVAISAGGNIITVLYHLSRVNQEIFREGFLPFSRFFASNHPFGTPMRALFFPLLISVFFLVVPTPDDVYDYVINLESYPQNIFTGLICIGILILRRRKTGVEPAIKASYIQIAFMTLLCLFLTLAPLNPSKKPEFTGFPNYAYTGLVVLSICMLYWTVMFRLLPRIGHYDLVRNEITLGDGLVMKEWVKDYNYLQHQRVPGSV